MTNGWTPSFRFFWVLRLQAGEAVGGAGEFQEGADLADLADGETDGFLFVPAGDHECEGPFVFVDRKQDEGGEFAGFEPGREMGDNLGVSSVVDENVFEALEADAADVAVALAHEGLAADCIDERAFSVLGRVGHAGAVTDEEHGLAGVKTLHGGLKDDAEDLVHINRVVAQQAGELVDAGVEGTLEDNFGTGGWFGKFPLRGSRGNL